MTTYYITEEQVNNVLAVLGKVPAELSFNSIILLKNLSQAVVTGNVDNIISMDSIIGIGQ